MLATVYKLILSLPSHSFDLPWEPLDSELGKLKWGGHVSVSVSLFPLPFFPLFFCLCVLHTGD